MQPSNPALETDAIQTWINEMIQMAQHDAAVDIADYKNRLEWHAKSADILRALGQPIGVPPAPPMIRMVNAEEARAQFTAKGASEIDYTKIFSFKQYAPPAPEEAPPAKIVGVIGPRIPNSMWFAVGPGDNAPNGWPIKPFGEGGPVFQKFVIANGPFTYSHYESV